MKKDSELDRSEIKRLNTVLISVQADLNVLRAEHESVKGRNDRFEKQVSALFKRLEANEIMIEKNAGGLSIVKNLANSDAGKETVSDGPPLYLVIFILNLGLYGCIFGW